MKLMKYKMQFKNLNNKISLPKVSLNAILQFDSYNIDEIANTIHIIFTYNDQDLMIDDYIMISKNIRKQK